MKNILSIFVLSLASILSVQAAETVEQKDISNMMKAIWEKPDSVLDVSPITIQGAYAIAGWTQGHHGGRALLRKKQDGKWSVILCAGDALLDKGLLKDAGIPSATSSALLKQTLKAESAVEPQRRKQFSLFKNVEKMQ